MLFASSTVAPKTRVTALRGRTRCTAPPVAVLATKSSFPLNFTVCLSFRHCRVFASVYGELLLPPHPASSRQSAATQSAAQTGKRRTARQCTDLPGRARSSPLSSPLVPEADERLAAYARLAVQVGLNLQPGQTLGINALIEHAPLVRAIAREAYAAGADYVDVLYSDQHVRRAHIERAEDEKLGYSPGWLVRRLRELGEIRGALCAITGNPEPELFADLNGERVGKARMREVAEASLALTDGLCNWTIVAYPNAGWAETVLGAPDVERLWDAVAQAVRLDQPDPVAAWREHIARLQQRAQSLNERRFDHLRYRGPATDLTIGLHPDSEWQAALDESN